MGRYSCHYTDIMFPKLKTFFIKELSFKRNKSVKSHLQNTFWEEFLNFSDQHKRVSQPFNTAHATQGEALKNTLQKEILW